MLKKVHHVVLKQGFYISERLLLWYKNSLTIYTPYFVLMFLITLVEVDG